MFNIFCKRKASKKLQQNEYEQIGLKNISFFIWIVMNTFGIAFAFIFIIAIPVILVRFFSLVVFNVKPETISS